MKSFLQKYKWIIIKGLIVLVVVASIAVGAYFILRALGFVTKEDFLALRDKMGDSIWFWLTIGLLQIVQVIFIPVTNQIITIPCALVFPDSLWKVWLTAWFSIWLATLILYWLGRCGGKKVLDWILGDKEKVASCTRWLNRGWIFYPVCMLLPIPDDILTTLAGTAKMKFWFVALCCFITRGIDTACSVFGWGFLTRFWWGWIILISGIIALCLLTFFLWKYDQKMKKLEQETETKEELNTIETNN